jgi:hypothetical protein
MMPFCVVGHLDAGGHGAADADAVAAHDDLSRFCWVVEDREAHGVGVLGAELEDVADLDAAWR